MELPPSISNPSFSSAQSISQHLFFSLSVFICLSLSHNIANICFKFLFFTLSIFVTFWQLINDGIESITTFQSEIIILFLFTFARILFHIHRLHFG